MGLLAKKGKDIVTVYGNRYTEEEWELREQLADEAGEDELTEEERESAEQEFRAELVASGIEAEAIARLSAMGPLALINKIESGELRFSSPDRAATIEQAANAWGKKSYR